ncbi:MAG: thiamine-phosphate pyrophosphorylase [Sulfurimonas sp.]|jgi:thiamine-phosphate pyrophosphorylase|uniref:thiamine phosphate synthase n=1 Tax=Sulfurimonas sp. TaxID=2022749 RepID=UPI0039E6F252
MSLKQKLKGLYVISDDTLTPDETLFAQIEQALLGGASIVQLRDKKNSDDVIKEKIKKLQKLCKEHDAVFVLNDKIDLAIELECDGLHIGKSDHDRFDEIRKNYKGLIGVSCYGDIEMAKDFQKRGADYVAFGSFFTSPTKPNSNIIALEVLKDAKTQLTIPVCAIGGINTKNVIDVIQYKPDMISIVNDIWTASDITSQASLYANQF